MSFALVNIVYAAQGESFDTFLHKVNSLIINPFITLLFAVALVMFLYGVVEFLINAENEEKRTTGKQHMIWGIVGLTIMMGVFTILSIIMKTFDIKDIDVENQKVTLPDYHPSSPQVRP